MVRASSSPARSPALSVKILKPRKCKAPKCATVFIPQRPLQAACSHRCAQAIAEHKRKRAEESLGKQQRALDRRKREALKRPQVLKAEAQAAFNAYIRLRDAGKPCIDCGMPFEPNKPGGSMDAGHYLARSIAPHLRFNENNCFGQRKNCNRPGGTTRAEFRAGVEARIGLEALEALEADRTPLRLTADGYRHVRDTYREKAKALRKERKLQGGCNL